MIKWILKKLLSLVLSYDDIKEARQMAAEEIKLVEAATELKIQEIEKQATADIDDAFIESVIETNKYYEGRKLVFEDVGYVLRELLDNGVTSMALSSVITYVEKEEAKATATHNEDAEKIGGSLDDRYLRLRSAALILKGYEEEFTALHNSMDADALDFLADRVEEAELSLMESYKWAIYQGIRALAEIENVLFDEPLPPGEEDWQRAGDIFMPFYDRIVLRSLKHEITNRVTTFAYDTGITQGEFDRDVKPGDFDDLEVRDRNERQAQGLASLEGIDVENITIKDTTEGD